MGSNHRRRLGAQNLLEFLIVHGSCPFLQVIRLWWPVCDKSKTQSGSDSGGVMRWRHHSSSSSFRSNNWLAVRNWAHPGSGARTGLWLQFSSMDFANACNARTRFFSTSQHRVTLARKPPSQPLRQPASQPALRIYDLLHHESTVTVFNFDLSED